MSPDAVAGDGRSVKSNATESTTFGEAVIAAGLLRRTGVAGIYARSATFERIARALHGQVTALGGERFEALALPPVVARPVLARTGYARSFTHLIGSVHVLRGSPTAHTELLGRPDLATDWEALLEPADVMLSSAACHPVYPMCSGRLPPGGRSYEVHGYCFRHEPSTTVTRMRAFRMHELVRVADDNAARAHRDTGLADGLQLLGDLGLPMRSVTANDPFFGRGAALLADGQRSGAGKYEGVAPVGPDATPTALMSANYAADHFGAAFSITTDEGAIAHSSCVAFGIDRIALALLSEHGLTVERWPSRVRARLWP